MNKEEIYKSIEHIAKCGLYDTIEVNFLKSKFDELQQQNKKYKEVIDKAIDYIENNATSNYFDKEKNMFRREEDLLEILKGVE